MRSSDRRRRDKKRHARSCEGKRRYKTPEEARAAAARYRRDTGALSVNAYKCRNCGSWHFGHGRAPGKRP